MRYCSSCMVSFLPETKNCTLCGAQLSESETTNNSLTNVQYFPPKVDVVLSSPDKILRRRGLWILILSVCFSIPAAVCIVVDQMMNVSPSWSLWVLVALSFSWTMCMISFLFYEYPLPMGIVMGASLLVHFYFFGMLSGSLVWVFGLAWPISVLTIFLTALVTVFVYANKNDGYRSSSIILLAVSLLCLGIDLFIQQFLEGSMRVTWSLIVLVSCVPLTILLSFIGEFYRRSPWLQRILHF